MTLITLLLAWIACGLTSGGIALVNTLRIERQITVVAAFAIALCALAGPIGLLGHVAVQFGYGGRVLWRAKEVRS